MMTLREYVEHYRLGHDIKRASTGAQLTIVRHLEKHLGRPATLADLNTPTINAWLADAQEQLACETIYSYRRQILTLWREAHAEKLVTEYPFRIRRIRRRERVIEGWDAEQMGLLIAACDKLKGVIHGVRIGGKETWLASSRRPWKQERSAELAQGNVDYLTIDRRALFRAFFLVQWETGLRLGDVLSIETAWIQRQADGSGVFTIIQQKVGRRIHRTLRPETMKAIDATIPPRRKMLFPLWCNENCLFKAIRVLVKAAGLTGTSKYVRRGSASEVEKLAPGCGKLHLGHSPKSVGLFEQNYAVWRICGRTAPLPPPIVFAQPKGGAA